MQMVNIVCIFFKSHAFSGKERDNYCAFYPGKYFKDKDTVTMTNNRLLGHWKKMDVIDYENKANDNKTFKYIYFDMNSPSVHPHSNVE